MTEQQANKSNSDIDLMWINGEHYQQQINGLYGPWTDKLPNAKNIDFKILSWYRFPASKSTV
jgi:putative spermidine/putrescine transport system substrate-binding protein